MISDPGIFDDDDMNKPLIEWKRSGGKKSSYIIADKGRTQSSSKADNLIVYKRTRFRGASNRDSRKRKNDLKVSGHTNGLTAPVHVSEGPMEPLTTGLSDDANAPVLLNYSEMHSTCPGCPDRDPNCDTVCLVMSDKQVEEQSGNGAACNNTLGIVLQLALPSSENLKDATQGFSDNTELIHQKVNSVEQGVKCDKLDCPPMDNAQKERLSMPRLRQKARIAPLDPSMATKPQIAELQGSSVPFLRSESLVTEHNLSLSRPSNLNPGWSGSGTQRPSIAPSDRSLQPPRLSSGSGNSVKSPREKSQLINSNESNPRVKLWFEEELDALWIGVRRHGVGSWESIIKDPTLYFSHNTKPEHLSQRWGLERLKALEVVQEPAKLPEGQHTNKVLPKSPKQASGYLKRKLQTIEENASCELDEGRAGKQTPLLGGVSQPPDTIAGSAEMNDTANLEEELSSEETISV